MSSFPPPPAVILCANKRISSSWQNYVTMSGVRYVDLGLGTHRAKCRIHPNFRLVLIAEDKVTKCSWEKISYSYVQYS